jgi:hypothetical protein
MRLFFQKRHIYDEEGTQQERLLRLLQKKKVVPLPLIRKLGIASHTKVISCLRDKGHLIDNKCKPESKRVIHSIYYYHGQLLDNQLPCEQ